MQPAFLLTLLLAFILADRTQVARDPTSVPRVTPIAPALLSVGDVRKWAREGHWMHLGRTSQGARGTLSIAALSASRRMPALTAMCGRMRQKGMAPKTILIAMARHLLLVLNAMIQNGRPLQNA